jgi:membrane protein
MILGEIKMLKRWIQIAIISAKKLLQDGYTYQASALSFTTFLALVPLLSATLSLLTIFPIFTKVINLTKDYVIKNFIPISGQTIQAYLETFAKQASGLPIFSLVFLFFTAFMLVITVKYTLSDIWPKSQKKKQIFAWLLYWIILIIIPFFIALSTLLGSYLFSISWLGKTTSLLGLKTILIASLSLLCNILLFSILYFIVSNNQASWRNAFLGGFTAAILFEIAKKGFEFYIIYFPSYQLIYGALAIIPIFLVWLYIAWLIILYGALVTHVSQTIVYD